jgi:HK97 gp10 family phage protein
MTKAFRVKVEGLRQIETALHELPKATAKNVMRRVLREKAQPIADTATALAPVLSGDLKESVAVSTKLSKRARRGHRKLSPNAVEVFVGPFAAPRSIAQEFGTIDHAPQPFMRPAWDKHQDSVLEGIGEAMWAEIKKAAARQARKAAKAAAAGGEEGEP